MTLAKEPVYPDAQILNPGPKRGKKNPEDQSTGTKIKKEEVWHAGRKEVFQRIGSVQVCQMPLLCQVGYSQSRLQTELKAQA